MGRMFVVFLLLFSGLLRAEVTHVDNAQLKSLLTSGVPVIDVRTAPEWKQTGVVAGSHLITFFDEKGNYDVNAWLRQLEKVVSKDQPFVLICRSGNRTGTISQFLDNKLAYTKVHNVRNGIKQWIAAGNPTEKPSL